MNYISRMQETKPDTLADGFYFLRDGEQLGPYQLPEVLGQFTMDHIWETHSHRLDDLESPAISFLGIMGILFVGMAFGLIIASITNFIKSIK